LGFYIAPQFENVPKRYFVNSTNTNGTSPYVLWGIQLGYTYKPWNMSVYFQGANLANTSYISAVVTGDALGPVLLSGRRPRLLRRPSVEVVMSRRTPRMLESVLATVTVLALAPAAAGAAGFTAGGRVEITRRGAGHEVHVSAPAVAVGR